MPINNLQLFQDVRNPNSRWLQVGVNQPNGTTPIHSFTLTPEQFAQFQNSGIAQQQVFNMAPYAAYGGKVQQYQPGSLKQFTGYQIDPSVAGHDPRWDQFDAIASKIDASQSTGGQDLANDPAKQQDLVSHAMGGSQNFLTPGSQDFKNQQAAAQQSQQMQAQPTTTVPPPMPPGQQANPQPFVPPNQDQGMARNLGAEQGFVKNWGGKEGRLPTSNEINQAVYGNKNPQFNVPTPDKKNAIPQSPPTGGGVPVSDSMGGMPRVHNDVDPGSKPSGGASPSPSAPPPTGAGTAPTSIPPGQVDKAAGNISAAPPGSMVGTSYNPSPSTSQPSFRPRGDSENMTDYLSAKQQAGGQVDFGTQGNVPPSTAPTAGMQPPDSTATISGGQLNQPLPWGLTQNDLNSPAVQNSLRQGGYDEKGQLIQGGQQGQQPPMPPGGSQTLPGATGGQNPALPPSGGQPTPTDPYTAFETALKNIGTDTPGADELDAKAKLDALDKAYAGTESDIYAHSTLEGFAEGRMAIVDRKYQNQRGNLLNQLASLQATRETSRNSQRQAAFDVLGAEEAKAAAAAAARAETKPFDVGGTAYQENSATGKYESIPGGVNTKQETQAREAIKVLEGGGMTISDIAKTQPDLVKKAGIDLGTAAKATTTPQQASAKAALDRQKAKPIVLGKNSRLVDQKGNPVGGHGGVVPAGKYKVGSGSGMVAGTKVSPGMAGDVEDVLSGRNTLLNIRQTMGRSNKAMAYMESMRSAIRKVDPNFDFVAADAGGKMMSSSFYQKSMTAINAVRPNLDKVVKISNQVGRVGIAGLNKLFQAGAVQIGSTKVATLHEAQKLLADEIGVALGQGAASDMKLQLGLDLTDPSLSQAQFAANIGKVKEFLDNREKSLTSLRYASSKATGGNSSSDKGNVDFSKFYK